MYCPRCGSNQSEELKFCKSCGANLSVVRQAIEPRAPDDQFNWSKTWVAEMFLSAEEQERRKVEVRRLQGITPEVRRYQEIKAGVITSSVGIAVTIFLALFMQGLAQSGKVPPDTAEILTRIWAAGLIPTFVGAALIVNGWFVSKRMVELAKRNQQDLNSLNDSPNAAALRPADTSQFAPPGFSVTEGTTKHLKE